MRDSRVLNPCYVGSAAAPWILIHPLSPGWRETELGDLSSLLHHRRRDTWYGSPRLTRPRAVTCITFRNMSSPTHTCSAWHMTLSPPQSNPVTVFSMLFRNLVTPSERPHTHTHTHTPAHRRPQPNARTV